MRSGGGLPLALVHGTYSVDVHDPARDVGKQLRRVNVFSAMSSVFQITDRWIAARCPEP